RRKGGARAEGRRYSQARRGGWRGVLGRQGGRKSGVWEGHDPHVQADVGAGLLRFGKATESEGDYERRPVARLAMPGFTGRQLVLVKAVLAGPRGASFSVGTGYFVTADLVLTASHVVPEQGRTDLEVRLEKDDWRKAEPVWRDASLDAALLRITPPLADTPEVTWVETDFDANVAWQSSGYPDAGKVIQDDKPFWKTVGLDGVVKAHGGGGQGPKELELTVDAPPKAAGWAGISGAPVFVGEFLAGFIKEVPESFEGGRLAATPAASLLQSAGFRLALSPPWLETPSQGVWVLVVLAETKKGQLADWVDGALVKHSKMLGETLGTGPIPKAFRVSITEALASPGHWLR